MTHPAAAPRPAWLVAAVSGRMLAASAGRAGHRVVVLDCFADRDTRAVAAATRVVSTDAGPRFDRRLLLRAAEELRPPAGWAGIIAGSGFEARPGLLARLAASGRLLGNSPEVVALVKDPDRFFPLLRRIGARHPEVSRRPSPDASGWLVKQAGGAGGTHVRRLAGHRARRGRYFQREEPGRTLSVLFLADGRRGFRVGVNEQWTAAHPEMPFLYSGAVGGVALPEATLARLDELLDSLVTATGIVGLNGVDFLLQGSEPSILELNPRPTATLELHDADWPTGLFDCHLRACAGELPAARPGTEVARAAALVLAPAQLHLGPTVEFPAWCHDLPDPGTAFPPHAPVCTVHAQAPTPEAARRLVLERQQLIVQRITAGTGRVVAS